MAPGSVLAPLGDVSGQLAGARGSGPTHVALSGPPLTHVVFSGPPLTSVLRTFIFVWDVAVMVQNHAAVIHSHRSHGRDWAYSHVMAACKEVGIRP